MHIARMMNHRVAGLLVGAAAATSVFGQAAHPLPEHRNAALVYSAVFYSGLPKELTEKVDAVEYADVKLDQPIDKQPEAFKLAAEEARARSGTVEQLLAASRMTRCDFELPYENGIGVVLPHLSFLRKSARLLRLDARRLLIEGKPDEAAERVAALFRIAGQLKSDEILINTLVGVAIASGGNTESEVLIKSGVLTASGRENILGAINTLGAVDPYGFKTALRGEQRITVGWVRTRYAGQGGQKLVEEIERDWGMVKGSREELNLIGKMDEKQLKESLDQLDGYHELIQSMWDLPDAPARLEVIGSRIEKGDFGQVAKFMAPAISRACSASQKAAAELATTVKALKDYVPSAPKHN
jgi:hypothetical protein